MELFIFARFHAREGQTEAVAAALRETVTATREESGCLAIDAFRSTRDPALFYIHSGLSTKRPLKNTPGYRA